MPSFLQVQISAIMENLISEESNFLFKGCLVWGSRTSILISYLESAGLFIPGVKFSSYSDKPLSRYYSIQYRQKTRYGKPKYRESLSPDDIVKSHSYLT